MGSGGGGGDGPPMDDNNPTGVTFSSGRISQSNRKGARPPQETDALSQPMAGSKSANPYSVSTRRQSQEADMGIGFRTDESGGAYAIRIDRQTGKSRSYAQGGKPSTADRIDYSKALEIERRFKAGEKMTDSAIDALLQPNGDKDDRLDTGSATEDTSAPKEGVDLGKAARRAAQSQKGAATRKFYSGVRPSGL